MDKLGDMLLCNRAGRLGLWLVVATAAIGCRDDGATEALDDDGSTGTLDDGSGDADDESTGVAEAMCGNGVVDLDEDCDEGQTDHHGSTCNAHCEVPGTLRWSWQTDLRLGRALELADGDIAYAGYALDGSTHIGRLSPPSDVVWEHSVSTLSGTVRALAAGDRLYLSGTDAETLDDVLYSWSHDGTPLLAGMPIGRASRVFELSEGLLAYDYSTESVTRLDLDGQPQWTTTIGSEGASWELADVAERDGSILLLLHDHLAFDDPTYRPAIQQLGADGDLGGMARLEVGAVVARHMEVVNGRVFVAGEVSYSVSAPGSWMAEVDGDGSVVTIIEPLDDDPHMVSFVVDSFGNPVVTATMNLEREHNGPSTIVRYTDGSPSWTLELGDDRQAWLELSPRDDLLVRVLEPDKRMSLRAYTP